MTKNFESLGITPKICELLHKQGVDEPTAIQAQAIPPLFKGRDILAQAQTGTGKTFAFLLPSLQQIKTDIHAEQVLVMAPTRELARQIADVADTLAPELGIDVLSLIGGKTIENQLQKLHRHPHVIIGTPGRLLDHCRRHSLDLSGVRRVIVDEADQMLQAGFLEDVDTLIGLTPKRRQLLFFSATVPDKIKGLAKKHMQSPLVLNILEGQTIALENIEQRIYMMTEEQKLPKLCQMLTDMNPYLAIVFCNTKERTSLLAGKLIAKGFNIGELHGDMSQGRRNQVLRDFAKAKTQILVATDIAARGIDIEGITHVFNFDVPHDVDYYIHRIGRTGRAGSEGLSIMFATAADENWVRRIEHNIHATITKYTLTGQVKVKASSRPPKKKKTYKDKQTQTQTQQQQPGESKQGQDTKSQADTKETPVANLPTIGDTQADWENEWGHPYSQGDTIRVFHNGRYQVVFQNGRAVTVTIKVQDGENVNISDLLPEDAQKQSASSKNIGGSQMGVEKWHSKTLEKALSSTKGNFTVMKQSGSIIIDCTPDLKK